MRAIHHVKRFIEVIREVASILFRITDDGGGEESLLENTGVFGKEAEEQAGDENVQVVQVAIAPKVVVGTQLVMQFGQLLSGLDVSGILLHITNPLHIHQGIEESEVARQAIEWVLVGLFLSQVIGQKALSVADGHNLGCRFLDLDVSLQLFQCLGQTEGSTVSEAEQPFDQQSIKGLEDTLTLLVTLDVAFAFAKGVEQFISHLVSRSVTFHERLRQALLYLPIAKLCFLCHGCLISFRAEALIGDLRANGAEPHDRIEKRRVPFLSLS